MTWPIRFRAGRRGLASVLGPLEAEVLERLWEAGDGADVGEIRAALRGAHAYTTVKTVMERMTGKGLLRRERVGRAYRYRPALARRDLEARVSRQLSQGLLDGFGDVAVAHFVDAVREDPAQMRRLRELLDELGERGEAGPA